MLQHVYGNKSKSQDNLRFLSYSRMVAKRSLIPSRIPPTEAAATEHVLSAYLQYHNWVMLDTGSLNPLEYGWELTREGHFTPTSTKTAMAPTALLNLICCNSSVDVEEPCSKRCSCRRYVFQHVGTAMVSAVQTLQSGKTIWKRSLMEDKTGLRTRTSSSFYFIIINI